MNFEFNNIQENPLKSHPPLEDILPLKPPDPTNLFLDLKNFQNNVDLRNNIEIIPRIYEKLPPQRNTRSFLRPKSITSDRSN